MFFGKLFIWYFEFLEGFCFNVFVSYRVFWRKYSFIEFYWCVSLVNFCFVENNKVNGMN